MCTKMQFKKFKFNKAMKNSDKWHRVMSVEMHPEESIRRIYRNAFDLIHSHRDKFLPEL